MMRILVVEDDRLNLELFAFLLRAWGHILLTAHDGEEGVQLALQERPDIILCDLLLPGADGFEVAQRLKSHPTTRTIPLVAVTASSLVGDPDKAVAAGFDGYFTKPIDVTTFNQSIQSLYETFLSR